jgi:hypothetical protein
MMPTFTEEPATDWTYSATLSIGCGDEIFTNPFKREMVLWLLKYE